MTVEVRPCTSLEELQGALGAIWQYFGGEPQEEETERFSRALPPERAVAAFDGERTVGGGGAFAFDMTVPGGSLPCAGVTVIGVDPTHRRRGVLRQLMRRLLDDAHERGEPIAALWASEAAIYGRFGFGLASLCGELKLARERTAFAVPIERSDARFVSVEQALELFPSVYDRVRAVTPGMCTRSPAWWESRVLSDLEGRRQGGGPARRVVVEEDGAPAGYGIYRHHAAFEHASTVGSIRVIEALGATPSATAAIWRYLLDVDWIAHVKAGLMPLDHPLFLLLAEPRRMEFMLADALWVRLLDVGAALSARGYGPGDQVVFDVRDEFCPWNEGGWRLADGAAERTDAEPDLRLSVDDLATPYLGGFTFAELARAGRLEELRPGAVERADALFRSDRLPWCPEIF